MTIQQSLAVLCYATSLSVNVRASVEAGTDIL